jgi:hypothetical protein
MVSSAANRRKSRKPWPCCGASASIRSWSCCPSWAGTVLLALADATFASLYVKEIGTAASPSPSGKALLKHWKTRYCWLNYGRNRFFQVEITPVSWLHRIANRACCYLHGAFVVECFEKGLHGIDFLSDGNGVALITASWCRLFQYFPNIKYYVEGILSRLLPFSGSWVGRRCGASSSWFQCLGSGYSDVAPHLPNAKTSKYRGAMRIRCASQQCHMALPAC